MINYTPSVLDKIEQLLKENFYTVRYEQGNFQTGWCLLENKKIIVINKFLTTQSRIQVLIDIVPQLQISEQNITSADSSRLYAQILNEFNPIPH